MCAEGSAEAEGAREFLERVDVEGCSQSEIDLVGSGLDVLADAIDDLLIGSSEHTGPDSLGEKAELAAEALGITAHRLKALNLIDKIVSEPVGGAHRDPDQMAAFLKRALGDAWRQVADLKPKELLERRYERLQSYGRYTDTKAGK